MSPGLKRGATLSAGLHLAVLLALILVIPAPPPPPPPPDDSIEMEFEGTASSAQKSEAHGQVAAVAEADHKTDELPALEKPKPQPLEKPPPPPPPPPKPPQPQTVQTLAPEKLLPPPPAEHAEAIKPPPPVKVPPTKEPPKVLPPEKPLDTVTHQPNHTKNPAVDTKSFDNTMEKLLADQKQTKPPTHVYNPDRGGVANAGGQRHGNVTGDLTAGQRKTIGDAVRRCYSEDTAAKDYATYVANMTVTVDATGVVRQVTLSAADLARENVDPAFRAFAERAERAVLDPECATLPLPPALLGQPSQQLSFRFRP
jgi:outer membrane biosynthesis protein TonB